MALERFGTSSCGGSAADFPRPFVGDAEALRLRRGFFNGEAFPRSMSSKVFRLDGTNILKVEFKRLGDYKIKRCSGNIS